MCKKTLYRCARILYNINVSKLHNRQFETILSLNKTTGAAGKEYARLIYTWDTVISEFRQYAT